VVCVQCVNVSREWALGYVPDALERLERDCKAATTRQGVEDVINAVREDLRRAAASPEAMAASETEPAERCRAVVRLADDPGVGPDGLARVAYVLHEASEANPRQARVPRVGTSEAEGVRAWAEFMEARFGQGDTRGLTRVLVGAAGEAWVDLILGAPDWSHFRALRYSTAVVVPDTQTPYSLEDDFVRVSADFVARCRTAAAAMPATTTGRGTELPVGESAAVGVDTPPALAPIPGLNGVGDEAMAPVAVAAGRPWKWMAIWIVLGGLLLLGVAVLVLVSRAEQSAGAGR
jgi:hypothetical protein